jgi:hypothetical protein
MRHPVSYLLYLVRTRMPKLLNSFMAASMLLNTFSPIMFLGDLGHSYDSLKGYKYYGEPRQVKPPAPAPELAYFSLGAPIGPELSAAPTAVIQSVPTDEPAFSMDSAIQVDLGASLSPGWLNVASDQPDLGSGVVPTWMAAASDEADMGSDLFPSWMSVPAADSPPVSGDVGNCPAAANLDAEIIVPANPVNRGDDVGEIFTVTVTNNDATPVEEVSFLVNPNRGFYYVGGSASATSDYSGTLTIVGDPGTTAPDDTFTIDIAGTAPDKQLAPGETITLNFTLATAGNATSGQQLSVGLQDGSGTGPGVCITAVENVQTVRGNLVIEKLPVTQDGTLGDVINWTVRLRNTGLGNVYDAVFTDTVGIGYTGFSISPPINPIDLAPETFQDYTVQATIASCKNLTNHVDASWSIGNADGSASQAIPLVDDVDIIFLLDEPQIVVEIGDLPAVNYCGSFDVTVPVTVTNSGGTGQDLVLNMGTSYVTVDNPSAGWSQPGGSNTQLVYIGGTPAGSILSGETLNFTIDVSLSSDACVTGNARVSLQPEFYDACRILLDSSAAGVTTEPVANNAATLNILKAGPDENDTGQIVVAAGDTFVYTITVWGDNQQSIDAGGITILDSVPTALTITNITRSAGSHTLVGNNINWSLPVAGTGSYIEQMLVTVEVPELGGGVCNAGSDIENTVTASADVCPECTPLASQSELTVEVNDYLGTNNGFTKTVETVEMCADGTGQTVQTVLDIQDGITWTNSIYTDTLGQGSFALPLNVVNGSVLVEIEGVDRTADVTTTLGPPLVIDFSAIGTYSSTALITITYNITAPVGATVGDAASQSEFLYSEFQMGGGGEFACAGGGVGHVGAEYTIYRGNLETV